jgi:hypothetical protein
MISVASEESSTEPDCSELETPSGEGLTLLSDQDLRAATADIDEHKSAIKDWHCLQDTEMDEARFFHTGDHIDLNTCLLASPVDELAGVLRLSDRTRRHGVDIGAMDGCDARESFERFDPTIDGIGFETLHVTGTGTESDHLLLAFDDLE